MFSWSAAIDEIRSAEILGKLNSIIREKQNKIIVKRMVSFSASWKPSEKLVEYLQGIKKRRLGEFASKSIKTILKEEKDHALAAVVDLVKPSEVTLKSAHAQMKYKKRDNNIKIATKDKTFNVPISSLEKKIRNFKF